MLITTLIILSRFIFLGFNEMLQFASFAGLGGINFILSWSGTVGVYAYKNWIYKKILLARDLESLNINRAQKVNKRSLFNPILIYFVVLFLVIGYGSIRISTSHIPFYQQNIETTASSNFTKVGCVIKALARDDANYYIDRTKELAASGSKFILWSETAASVTTMEGLDILKDSIRNISTQYGVYIGYTYINSTSSGKKEAQNKLTVISPNGETLIDYAKSNLVPFEEDNLKPGSNNLQTSVTPDFGTIGGAICFDYDFPKLIGQASKKKVDFMLDSSWTWGN